MLPISLMAKPILYFDQPIYHQDGLDEKKLFEKYRAFDLSRIHLLEEKIRVKKLRAKDIKRAAKTYVNATVHDPISVYVRDTADARNPKLTRKVERLQYKLGLLQWSRKKIVYTVNHGASVVCAPPAPIQNKDCKSDKNIEKLLRLISGILVRIGYSKEQRKRLEEVQTKITALIEESLGVDALSMRVINSLATAPEYQGRGYGGALVDEVTRRADAEGRSSYLISSNTANTEFYNSHGFFTLAETVVGNNNPTWKGPPISMPLMIRVYGDQ